MSIYTVNGAELSNAYGTNGSELSNAYSVDGSIIFTKGSPQYPISNVQSYFRARTQEVENQIKALSSEWQSVVFVTDMHSWGNRQHSQAIALYLLANTPVKCIILGGDFCFSTWDESEYSTYVSPLLQSGFLDDIYTLYGNHELWGSSAADSAPKLYADFLESKSNISGNLQSIYYYFDDADNKTRFVFINTSDGSQYVMPNTQLEWLQSVVQLPNSTWSVIVFGHVNIDDLGGMTTDNEQNGAAIATAIASSNGSIIGYICGHQHIDGISTISGFHQATLYCDKLENSNYYPGYSVTDRERDTIQEQAVSVISFNTTSKQVVIRRIGVQSPNQTLAYSY